MSQDLMEKRGKFRILGIDPGYARLGYAVLDFADDRFTICDFGCIETSAKTPFPERLALIYDGLSELCRRFEPTDVAIEELFFAQNTTTAIGVAQARGVAVLAGSKCQANVYEYTPLQVKMAVVGYGNADKQQVRDMVCRILRLRKPPKLDDITDALAVAICHGHTGARQDFLAVGGYQ